MKKILLFFAFMAFFQNIYADSVLGGTLGYKFLSSSGETSTYRVTLELYTTCVIKQQFTSEQMTRDAEIWVVKSGVRMDRPLLVFKGMEDLTPVCQAYSDSTTCNNYTYPYISVMKYTYSSDIEISGHDSDWKFEFHGIMIPYARAELFLFLENVNIVHDAASEIDPIPYDLMYLEARLNNMNGPNNSPTYTSVPSPYFCKGKTSYYSMGAEDPDHDNLKFRLISARKTVGTYYAPTIAPITYYAPFTGEKPLPVTPGNFYLNPDNSQMVFTPDSSMSCLVVMEADEYKDGILVGSSLRQMTFLINNGCDATPPVSQANDFVNADHAIDVEGNLYLSACEGLTDTVSFDVDVTDPNGDEISVIADNLPDAAIITIANNNTQNPIVHFKWDLIDAQPFTYLFHITYTDDGCPMEASRNLAYTFNVIPHNIKFDNGASGSCLSVADGKAWVVPIGETSIDYTYKWVDTTTGNILRNVTSKTGDSLLNIPLGIYKVYVRNMDGCGKNFFIKVDTTLLPKLDLPNDTTICKGMYLNINTEPEIATTYQWNTGQNECCFKATESNKYILTATNHCGTSTASVNLDVVKCSYCFFIPNAFTPNGDGNNDVFKITPTCLTYKYKLFIYNRWGQLVFNSYDLQQSWDGTYKGQEAQQGTYYYVLDATLDNPEQEKIHLTGDVNVIK